MPNGLARLNAFGLCEFEREFERDVAAPREAGLTDDKAVVKGAIAANFLGLTWSSHCSPTSEHAQRADPFQEQNANE